METRNYSPPAGPATPRPIVPLGERLTNRIDALTSKLGALTARLSLNIDHITGAHETAGQAGLQAVPNGIHGYLDRLDEALDRLSVEIARLED